MKIEKNKKPFKLRKKERHFLMVSFIWCLILSVIFLVVLNSLFSKEKITDLGTTFGGFVGVFVAFFGSILVYLALKAQVKANQLVQDQFSKQEETEYYRTKTALVNDKINFLKNEINNFFYLHIDDTYTSGTRIEEYKGSQAIYILLKKNHTTFYGKLKRDSFQLEPKFTELYKLLIFFKETIIMINLDTFDNDEESNELIKSNFKSTLKYLFEAKIKWNFKSLEAKKSKHEPHCEGNCGLNHGLPSELFDLVDDINIKLDASL